MDDKIMERLECLPEELELTEHEWYEYHYNLRRNMFLLGKILALPGTKNIYVMEPCETYIGSILTALGYRIVCNHWDKLQTQHFSMGTSMEDDDGTHGRRECDVMLLLNIMEYQSEHPVAFLEHMLSVLKTDGKLFLATENIFQFKNRLKLLFGCSIFSTSDGNLSSYRRFSISDTIDIFSHAKLNVQEHMYVSLYPPFKVEPLTVRRYLVKYFNYFVMKAIPYFRDTIFIAAERANAHGVQGSDNSS